MFLSRIYLQRRPDFILSIHNWFLHHGCTYVCIIHMNIFKNDYLAGMLLQVKSQSAISSVWVGYLWRLSSQRPTRIAKFMGPTWGPPRSCRPQMGPMLAPWNLLSSSSWVQHEAHLGPVGLRWAPCWPHEICYKVSFEPVQFVWYVWYVGNIFDAVSQYNKCGAYQGLY